MQVLPRYITDPKTLAAAAGTLAYLSRGVERRTEDAVDHGWGQLLFAVLYLAAVVHPRTAAPIAVKLKRNV